MAAILPLKVTSSGDLQTFQTGDYVDVTHGGTGLTSTAAGDLLLGSGANTWSLLTIGTANQALITNGTTASWGTVATQGGGTGLTSTATGDILLGSGANTWSLLTIGAVGTILTSNGTTASWAAAPAGMPVLATFTNANAGSITVGQVVYISSNDHVDLAKADSITTARAIGVVYDASIATTASGNIQIFGEIDSILSAATAGAEFFLSDSAAGAIVNTAPSTAGHVITKLGVAENATDAIIRIQEPILL